MTTLRALGWNHPRCTAPMRACSDAWLADRGVDITWDWRSLAAFGDQPLEDLVSAYDLVIIDHPFCGLAAEHESLAPLDALVAPDALAALAEDSVGPSHASYWYGRRQWGFATDAACQVLAYRADLLDRPPTTWEALLELARRNPGRIGAPLSPPHAISSFLTLCANRGHAPVQGDHVCDQATGTDVIAFLAELAALGPSGAIAWEPPDALGRLTSTDELLVVFSTYGYVNYGRSTEVERPCQFADLPSAGLGPIGSVLGGAGLAVSATSSHPDEAAAFAAWASGADAQRRVVLPAGGQPGSRTAWLEGSREEGPGGLFGSTLSTLESAWTRPRDPWWPGFQLESGSFLSAALGERAADPEAVFRRLDVMYRQHRRRKR